MKTKVLTVILLLAVIPAFATIASAQDVGAKKTASAVGAKTEKEEFDAAIALPPAERIEKLKAFVAAHPRSTLKTRALELIVSAHAALGDERLKAGDASGGTEQFRLAIAAIPAGMSDKLFTEVVSQIPPNLFLRGQREASLEVARAIEERVAESGIRLLNIASFYLSIEDADDAVRVANLVIKQNPDSSPAYQARAAAHRIGLRLDESVADYTRALELSPGSASVKRSLAELRRATGKTEQALVLYRELVTADATDEFARTGLVVSLFELAKKDEAERELETAIKDLPNSLALFSGTAYWFAAHNEEARAVELAQRAVEIEPRYVWGNIALARGLLAQKRPMDAERVLLMARNYGRFPTLDYELASVLSAAGLYGEAAATLSSFTLNGGQIETWLAGRTPARAESFIELIAPERRAGIFQFTAADSKENARSLKALLAFSKTLRPKEDREAINEADVRGAARDFISGDDEMRAFRRLYVAERLLEFDVALPYALELMEAVTSEVEPALRTPVATIALMAEDLYEARVQANRYGSTLNIPVVPRETLSNIMRGRIEELTGWTLFHQAKYADAVVRLRRAISVLPESSIWWRNSMWYMGASLEADGKAAEALETYYKSYLSGGPDPTRRAVIEGLYRRVNGSLDGLDEKIGPALVLASNAAAANESAQPAQVTRTESNPAGDTTTEPTPSGGTSGDTSVESPSSAPAVTPADSTTNGATSESKPVEPETKPIGTSNGETEPVIKPELSSTKTSDAVVKIDEPSEPAPDTSKGAEANVTSPREPDVQPTPQATPEPTPTEIPLGPPQPAAGDELHDTSGTTPSESKPAAETDVSSQRRERRVSEVKCTVKVSESALTIQNNGGRALIELTLDAGTSMDGITATTSDWSDLAVFPEPKSTTNSGVASFSITSITKKTGIYTVTFKTPCGSKDVTVRVN
jgi:tetratricopeptide (TPR) repeat protein